MSVPQTPRQAPSFALHFDNRFTRSLPADPELENHRRQVFEACFSWVHPTKVKAPELVSYSSEMATELGLSAEDCLSDHFTQVFAGNQLLPGMEPYATCYGGHQFGNWAGQLGDGRAINLGEVVHNKQRYALQLKGAGPTPYSRGADGLAVLRSSVREFLCSEAMYHLGVPTTRALSLILSGEEVLRDMFYDGNAGYEPGAVVCRVAPSFTRFGHFEILAAREEHALLKQLLDYTLRTDYAHLWPANDQPTNSDYAAWFAEVCERTAEMVVHWMRVGFVHGVMNTDNMSILGLTIDYGPYGWLEDYNPDWTPNTTDAGRGRYRFGNQPQMAHWNLAQLSRAIYRLTQDLEPLQAGLQRYADGFEQGWQAMMAQKLGLSAYRPEDQGFISEINTLLQWAETDMTLFYRHLAELDCESLAADLAADSDFEKALLGPLLPAFYQPGDLTPAIKTDLLVWLKKYQQRVQSDTSAKTRSNTERKKAMNQVNPKYVLRNYLAQEAIDKAEAGDFSRVGELLNCLRQPYAEQPQYEAFAQKRPEWARHRPGCSMLSCSS